MFQPVKMHETSFLLFLKEITLSNVANGENTRYKLEKIAEAIKHLNLLIKPEGRLCFEDITLGKHCAGLKGQFASTSIYEHLVYGASSVLFDIH